VDPYKYIKLSIIYIVLAMVATKSILVGCMVGFNFLVVFGPKAHFGHMRSPPPRVYYLHNCRYGKNMHYVYDV
jgi:hypothetical protein